MISDSNKKQTLNSFIENIACMSDKEYQERVWVRGEGPECDDIDDTICDFFDEDYILKKYKDFGITEKQYQMLMELYSKLRKFTDTYKIYSYATPTTKLIELSEWKEIRQIARKVFHTFNIQK